MKAAAPDIPPELCQRIAERAEGAISPCPQHDDSSGKGRKGCRKLQCGCGHAGKPFCRKAVAEEVAMSVERNLNLETVRRSPGAWAGRQGNQSWPYLRLFGHR